MYRSTLVLLAVCLVLNQLDLTETRSINHDEFGVEQDQLGDLMNLTKGSNCFCIAPLVQRLVLTGN